MKAAMQIRVAARKRGRSRKDSKTAAGSKKIPARVAGVDIVRVPSGGFVGDEVAKTTGSLVGMLGLLMVFSSKSHSTNDKHQSFVLSHSSSRTWPSISAMLRVYFKNYYVKRTVKQVIPFRPG
jgi:hypothetical protein